MSGPACAGLPPDYFHPPKGNTIFARQAKAACAGCDYGYECLVRWLGTTSGGSDYGVWFGTSPKERRGLKEPLRIALGIVPYSPWLEVAEQGEIDPEEALRRKKQMERKRRSRARQKAERAVAA